MPSYLVDLARKEAQAVAEPENTGHSANPGNSANPVNSGGSCAHPGELGGVDLAALDKLARSFAERDGQPGLAYGVVTGGTLAHSGGLGERWLGGPRPDASTVFRIASMTKSFTAATILLLRDEGLIGLDELAENYVDELHDLRLPSADSPRVTIRQLLTMTAGFPTDDPWGDRQQGLAAPEFSRLLRGGVRLGWAPGTQFEYSNLGYAILGKAIEAVTGDRYSDAVRSRILRPLGMDRTGYEAEEFDPADLARGYQRGSSGWTELVPDGNGAFAPMGGVFSTVADLARWVAGFADAFPPRDGAPNDHPLSRATRREMQLPQIAIVSRLPGSFPDAGMGSYGFGLFVEQDPVFGTIVQHSGGYPGYGSQMRWHPATGTGTIVLANGTYAHAGQLAARLLSELLRQLSASPGGTSGDSGAVGGNAMVGGAVVSAVVTGTGLGTGGAAGGGAAGRGAAGGVAASASTASGTAASGTAASGTAGGGTAGGGAVFGPAPADGRPWPQTLAARAEVDGLLQRWDDEVAARLFSPNVDWDQPFASRRAAIDQIRERIGDFRPDPDRAAEFDSPAHCKWWLRGDRGTVQAEIKLTPLQQPLVQSLRLAVPPAPGSPLVRLLDSLIGMINDGSALWPDWLPAAPDVDTALVARKLRVAAAWAGRCTASAFRAGDGEASTAVELEGQSGRLILSISVDEAGEVLRQAEITLLP
jgi:CubicO group peptidase (beta-lactamase class C family)